MTANQRNIRESQLYEQRPVAHPDKDSPLIGKLPSEEQLSRIISIVKVLKVFASCSVLAEGENYVTLAHFPCWLSKIDAFLSTYTVGIMNEHKHLLLDSLRKRMGYVLKEPNIALLAAAVHPKYASLPWLSVHLREKIWELIKEECCTFGALPPFEGDEDSKVRIINAYRGQMGFVVDILRCELEAVSAKNNAELNPLIFYARKSKEHLKCLFPYIGFLLSVPGTSAPTERLFRRAGKKKTKERNRLTGAHLEELYVIQSYYRSQWFDIKEFTNEVEEYVKLLSKPPMSTAVVAPNQGDIIISILDDESDADILSDESLTLT